MTMIVSISVGFQSIAWDRFRLFTPMEKGVLFRYVELAMLCELKPPDQHMVCCFQLSVIMHNLANAGEFYFILQSKLVFKCIKRHRFRSGHPLVLPSR